LNSHQIPKCRYRVGVILILFETRETAITGVKCIQKETLLIIFETGIMSVDKLWCDHILKLWKDLFITSLYCIWCNVVSALVSVAKKFTGHAKNFYNQKHVLKQSLFWNNHQSFMVVPFLDSDKSFLTFGNNICQLYTYRNWCCELFKYVGLVDSKLHIFLLCSTIDVGQKALAYSAGFFIRPIFGK